MRFEELTNLTIKLWGQNLDPQPEIFITNIGTANNKASSALYNNSYF